jgi:hypothetical protein
VDLTATTISVGYASGLNAYGTTLILCLLGRAGIGDVPQDLTSNPILIGSAVMFAIEFVVDKIPYLDDAWDVVHTVVRPVMAARARRRWSATRSRPAFASASTSPPSRSRTSSSRPARTSRPALSPPSRSPIR